MKSKYILLLILVSSISLSFQEEQGPPKPTFVINDDEPQVDSGPGVKPVDLDIKKEEKVDTYSDIELNKIISDFQSKHGEIKNLADFYSEDKDYKPSHQQNNLMISKTQLAFLLQNKSFFYSDHAFHPSYQGNPAQFLKIAYEKNLPISFTPDAFLYAFNTNLYEANAIAVESFVFPFLVKLYFKVYAYLDQLDQTTKEHKFTIREIKKFFAVFIELVGKGIEIEDLEMPSDIPKVKYSRIIQGIENHSQNQVIELMGVKQVMDFSTFMPTGFNNISQYLKNAYHGIKWLTSFKLNIIDDIHYIWFLAKVIHESKSTEIYNSLFEIIQYYYDGDTKKPSLTDIYKIGTNIGLKNFKLTPDERTLLVTSIFNQVKIKNLDFLREIFEKNAKKKKVAQEEAFSFLPRMMSTVEWAKKSLVDNTKKRLISFSDVLFSVFNNYGELGLIDIRISVPKDKIDGSRFVRFRDGIDYSHRLKGINDMMTKSKKEQTDLWRASLDNHYILMLSHLNPTPDEKSPLDLFESAKIGLTTFGAYVHFKNDNEQQRFKVYQECTNGSFSDFYIEPYLEFYQESLKLLNNLEDKMKAWVDTFNKEVYDGQKALNIFVRKTQNMREAINIFIKTIENQIAGTFDEEIGNKLQQVITIDGKHFDGWYIKLTKPELARNEEDLKDDASFHLPVFSHLFYVDYPEKHVKDIGYAAYEFTKHMKGGLSLVFDEKDKKYKILLFTTYNPMEANFTLDKKVEFNEVLQFIANRQ